MTSLWLFSTPVFVVVAPPSDFDSIVASEDGTTLADAITMAVNGGSGERYAIAMLEDDDHAGAGDTYWPSGSSGVANGTPEADIIAAAVTSLIGQAPSPEQVALFSYAGSRVVGGDIVHLVLLDSPNYFTFDGPDPVFGNYGAPVWSGDPFSLPVFA